MAVRHGEVREHVLREIRQEIRSLASKGLSAEEIRQRLNGNLNPSTAEAKFLHVDESSVKTLLGPGLAEGVRDSHALAAVVVLKMPSRIRGVLVREFLGWIQGSDDALVRDCTRAATVDPDATLGELNSFQRAALIGALRLQAELSEP